MAQPLIWPKEGCILVEPKSKKKQGDPLYDFAWRNVLHHPYSTGVKERILCPQ